MTCCSAKLLFLRFLFQNKRGLWINVNTRCVDGMPGAHAQDVLNLIVKLQACYKARFSSHKPNSISLLKRFICRLPRFGNDSCAGDRQQTPPKSQLTARTNGKLCRAALINSRVCSGLVTVQRGGGGGWGGLLGSDHAVPTGIKFGLDRILDSGCTKRRWQLCS